MRNPNNQHFKHLQQLVLMYPRCYFQKQMPWARNLHQIPHEQVMVVEVEKHRQLSIWPHQPCCLTLERTTSNSFRSAVKDSNYLSKKKKEIFLEKNITISAVMSLAKVPCWTIVLWIRNLSLHWISAGASLCACIVTETTGKAVALESEH